MENTKSAAWTAIRCRGIAEATYQNFDLTPKNQRLQTFSRMLRLRVQLSVYIVCLRRQIVDENFPLVTIQSIEFRSVNAFIVLYQVEL